MSIPFAWSMTALCFGNSCDSGGYNVLCGSVQLGRQPDPYAICWDEVARTSSPELKQLGRRIAVGI